MPASVLASVSTASNMAAVRRPVLVFWKLTWKLSSRGRPPGGWWRGAVPEWEAGLDDAVAPRLEQVEVAVVGDPSERQYQTQLRQRVEIIAQPRAAVGHFVAARLVAGRHAAGGGGDPQAVEPQPVGPVDTFGRAGQTGAPQRRVEKRARGVAGEHAAGAVAAVGAGREPQQQQAGGGVAEARHRAAPVALLAVAAPLLAGDPLAVLDQARAPSTAS